MKVTAADNHTTKWKFTPPDEDHDDYWKRTQGFHVGTCERCGVIVGNEAATKKGKVAKGNRRAAWSHLEAQRTRETIEKAPMQIVGKIIKRRVTNEIWIFSAYGDLPDEIAKRIDTKYNRQDYMRAIPWILAKRTSTGWAKWFSRYTFREQAYAAGLDILNEAFIEGHEIEIASQINMNTVQVPMGAVETYLSNLVEEAKTTEKPKDLVALQDRLKKARGMVELLEAAQELVQSKLVGIDPEPDSRYTEYEWRPK